MLIGMEKACLEIWENTDNIPESYISTPEPRIFQTYSCCITLCDSIYSTDSLDSLLIIIKLYVKSLGITYVI